jgi:integrase
MKLDFKIGAEFVDDVDRSKDAFYWCGALDGFGIRVQARTVSYVFRYGRGSRGVGRTLAIGRHGQPWTPHPRTGAQRSLTAELARKEALRLRGLIEDGQDPAAGRARVGRAPAAEVEAEVEARTFKAVATRLIAAADLADNTRRQWVWMLNSRLCPKLGARAVDSIKRADVRDLLYDSNGRPIRCANDVLKVARWIFGQALDDPKVGLEYNPARDIRRPTKARPRSRVLAPGELRAVWQAADREAALVRERRAKGLDLKDTFDLYCDGVQLALLTGARKSEIFKAPKREFDLQDDVWHIPEERQRKSRVAHDVPIVKTAKAILKARLEAGESEWLLPSRDAARPRSASSRPWTRLLIAAGILTEEAAHATTKGKKDPWGRLPFCFHDFRRTVRDMMTKELGVEVSVAEAVIGHVPPKIIGTYAPSGVSIRDKRRALDRWEGRLLRIVTGDSEKVVVHPASRLGRI